MRCLASLLTISSLTCLAQATGYFLTPSGADDSIALTEGQAYTITWGNVSTYSVLSLGYYSSENQTITWLISNAVTYPTSYTWLNVDASASGFDLQQSHLFRFYICEGFDFGDPFESTQFIIKHAPTSQSSTSSTSPTSSTTSATTVSSTTSLSSSTVTSTSASSSSQTPTGAAAAAAQPSPSSHSLSTGAEAGIAVGVIAGVALVALLIFFLVRRRKSQSPKHETESEKTGLQQEVYGNPPVVGQDMPKEKPYDTAHEISTAGQRYELGVAPEMRSAGGRVELP